MFYKRTNDLINACNSHSTLFLIKLAVIHQLGNTRFWVNILIPFNETKMIYKLDVSYFDYAANDVSNML